MTSSTKTTNFFPGGGIKIVLPFLRYVYNFYSILNYVVKLAVLAENVIYIKAIRPSSLNFSTVELTIIVLPVPVTPVINIGQFVFTAYSKNHPWATVSFV